MRRILSALVLAALLGGCGGSTDDDGQGTAGSGGAGGSGGGSGGSAGIPGSGGSGGTVPCGGIAPCCDSQGNPVDPICPGGGPAQCPPGTSVPPTGICTPVKGCNPTVPCSASEFCDYPDDLCGAGASGTCAPLPRGCDLLYAPVCGCDGNVHGNSCAAQSGGVDVSASGGCAAPTGYFACGSMFCETATQYCFRAVSDVPSIPDSYECKTLPPGCNAIPPSCSCLANEQCGDWCEIVGPGQLKLTCPGG